MPRRATVRKFARKPRARRQRRLRFPKLWPSARLRRRWWRSYRRAPAVMQFVMGIAAMAVLALALNWGYQVVRKPSELFFPVSGVLYKTPGETWREYAPIFRKHSTDVITPTLLAALAQVEGSGNPIVRTYWRWSPLQAQQPFEVYRPASSAVGMYQITDSTFAEAKRYCIHDHKVVEDGPWNDPHSCWFNSLYMRVVPAHAVELTSAYLHRRVAMILQRGRGVATLQQKQDLAAIIHLCGAGAGDEYARRGFHLIADQRCGDHTAAVYVAQVNALRRVFEKLAYGA